MDQSYMKQKPIFPLLLSLAVPMILSMLVNSLYNIVDSIFVAKISEDAMTSLSLVYPMQNLINSIAVGFGVGVNAVIALYLGAGENDRADAAATQGLVLNVIHGIALAVLGLMVMPWFLGMFTSNDGIIRLGLRYSTIVLPFAPIITAAVTYEKIFQAVGKMVVSMVSLLSGCVINIILDPVMIFGIGPVPAMGIEGAAWATGIGQTASLIIYLVVYYVRPIHVKLASKYKKLDRSLCLQLYSIGIPATLNMALPSVLISVLNGILAAISPAYVLVLGIYYKLQTFLYLPANGVVQGMRPLMSYNYGAGEHKRVKAIYRMSFLVIGVIMALGMGLCLLWPYTLVGMFTENPETIESGVLALRIISAGFIVSAVSVTSAGALEALGKGLQSLCISTLRYVVVIIPSAFLLSRFLGAAGVWHAFWISEFMTAAAAYRIYRKCTEAPFRHDAIKS